MPVLTAGAIAALAAIAAAAGLGTMGEQAIGAAGTKSRNEALKNRIKQQYPELSPTQVDALVAQYGDIQGGIWDVTKWGDQSDEAGLWAELSRIKNAQNELGTMPEMPSIDDLNQIQQSAYGEIDRETEQLLDLYNQNFQNSKSMLQNSLNDNARMFGDYRNQLLTNEAMQQQAIAGSTRFELDRQQRNAITRGASAAQRLVANINTQLGMQAQSAQQSLDTSNALAQNLLAHRQAQQGIRNDYMNAQNQYNNQMANTISGQAERRYNYGQARKQGAIDDYNYAYDAWNTRKNDYFQGDSLGGGIYSGTYGRNRQNKSSGI